MPVLRLLAVLLGLVVFAAPALADKVVPMVKTGSPANRLDLVILGDGYTASQMKTFATDAEKFRTAFFSREPFKSYVNYFNVTRIESVSATSGAGDRKPKNTAFGAYFFCFEVERLLCIVEEKVAKVVNANTAGNARDLVIVIVNDKRYGGSGGPYAVASTHEFAGDVAIHEFGHSFGHLDDEYVDDQNCGRYTNPWGFNVTQKASRTGAPWAKWIAPSQPVPTPTGNPDPGLFEGAYFCAKGWYRPTDYSMMRVLGAEFGPVNGEQLIRRTYEIVNVADGARPSPGTVKVPKTGKTNIRALPIDPALPTLRVIWRLDGVKIGTGVLLELQGKTLQGRTRTLTATIQDATKAVRKGAPSSMIKTLTWTVKPS